MLPVSKQNNCKFKGVTFVSVHIKRRFDLHLLAEHGGASCRNGNLNVSLRLLLSFCFVFSCSVLYSGVYSCK